MAAARPRGLPAIGTIAAPMPTAVFFAYLLRWLAFKGEALLSHA